MSPLIHGLSAALTPGLDEAEVADFHNALIKANRIVAIVGAGLSASSGLATFQGSSGFWKGQDTLVVASMKGLDFDPGRVWQFHSSRRREALRAKPNAAHFALAELARKIPGCVTLTQNIDNLHQRAGHPKHQLEELHGNLFDLRCVNSMTCGYAESHNYKDPLTPALYEPEEDLASKNATPVEEHRPRANILLLADIARKNAKVLGQSYVAKEASVDDIAPLHTNRDDDVEQMTAARVNVQLTSDIAKDQLPQCPQCKKNILRPGIVWFGEEIAAQSARAVEALFAEDAMPIDICLVIGTSSTVWPVAGFAAKAQKKGARVATMNMHAGDAKFVRPGIDWVFLGDAAEVVPLLLEPVVGSRETWESPPLTTT